MCTHLCSDKDFRPSLHVDNSSIPFPLLVVSQQLAMQPPMHILHSCYWQISQEDLQVRCGQAERVEGEGREGKRGKEWEGRSGWEGRGKRKEKGEKGSKTVYCMRTHAYHTGTRSRRKKSSIASRTLGCTLTDILYRVMYYWQSSTHSLNHPPHPHCYNVGCQHTSLDSLRFTSKASGEGRNTSAQRMHKG